MGKSQMIRARTRDLGGFTVGRVLPAIERRMVGPFVFFDHMGPADFPPGEGLSVRPHPHIHLATVTYLFEGKIRHRDSLGSNQLIEPGAINWMTAGRGIVHSERTPQETLARGGRLHGIQCWVALTEEHEDSAPDFTHYPAGDLPEFDLDGISMKLLVGSAYGRQSPVRTLSELFYLDVRIPKGRVLSLPAAAGCEAAAYLVSGRIQCGAEEVAALTMLIGEGSPLEAQEDSHVIVLGGRPLGERWIEWNFVSSRSRHIAQAKADWARGPGEPGSRFPKVPGDDTEFIPLPTV